MRKRFLASESLCRACQKEGLTVAAVELDHIQPLHKRPDLAMVQSNLQPLCREHHERKTARENGRLSGAALDGTPL